MKGIALIHTAKGMAIDFDGSLRNYLEYEVKVYNPRGDFLTNDPNEVGEFTIQNRNHLFCDMKAQELTGVDIIVTTCSTLTPAMELIRPFIWVSVVTTDDAMARRSVLYGKRIMVMATAKSTVRPTVSKIKAEADKAGREAGTPTYVRMNVLHAVKAMDVREHDMILREKTRELKGCDRIVLAQASMAHLGDKAASTTGCPALISPRLCMEEIKNKLGEI